MSIKIKSKNSVVKDKAPLPADLEIGELALNAHQDSPAIYLKDAAGAIRKVAGDATTTAKGIVQLADATAVTAGTAGRVVDAKELKDGLTFLQDGTDAKPRTYLSKLKDVVSVKDFGAKGDGTTDDTNAFKAALALGCLIHVPVGVYRVTDTLSFENSDITGEGWESVIEADIANAVTPLLQAGRSVSISSVSLRYKASRVTGSETQGERVLIQTFGGAHNYGLQRGSEIVNCHLGTCGTSIYSPSIPQDKSPFSVTFDTLEVEDFSFRGFDFHSNTRTGNVYRNIYISSSRGSVSSCFYLTGEESECVIDQLNAEHTSCSDAPVSINNVRALVANSIHIEGCDVSQPNKSYLHFEKSSGSIESLSVYYTRMTQDNTSVVMLGSTNYDDFGTLRDPNNMRYLRIGVLHLKGIARPHAALYPAYPANRVGLSGASTVTGFLFFNRPATYTSRDMFVKVDTFAWNSDGADGTTYISYPCDPHNNIAFISKGIRGKTVNGDWKSSTQFMVGVDTDNAHPLLWDRNADTHLPSYTWWFDDQTGISHPAAHEVGVTLNSTDTYRFKAGGLVPSFTKAVTLGSTSNVWSSVSSEKYLLGDKAQVGIFYGTGTPEGVVTADAGSLYVSLSGGTSTTLYVKENGAGKTGWVAK